MRKLSIVCHFFLILGLVLISKNSFGQNTGLKMGFYPLSGASAAIDFAPLTKIMPKVRIIALGESFHTSEGFHQERDRAIKFLVTKWHVRTILLETPWAEALIASQYVQSCKGNPQEAVDSFLDIWRSKTFAGTLKWLCNYNLAHPNDKVSFNGIDIQDPWADAKILRAYISKLSASPTNIWEGITKCVGASSSLLEDFKQSNEWNQYVKNNKLVPESDNSQCLGALASLKNITNGQRVIIAATSLSAWQQRWFLIGRDNTKALNARDEGMSEMFQSLYSRSHSKRTILIGHNYHIAMASVPGTNLIPLGNLLKEKYGSAYEAVGLIGYDVRSNWSGTQFQDQTPPLIEDSVESYIHNLHLGNILLDAQLIFPGVTLTNIYNNGVPQPTLVKDQFRALLFLDYSGPMIRFTQGD